LIFFEEAVNSDVYVGSLKTSGFVSLADATFGERGWFLVQDGASCHTSTRSLDALFEICNVFPQWPPNSPDLNPIECLWGAIKRQLRWNGIQTREEAIEIIQRAWSEFEQSSIDALVLSFANRIQMMGQAQGRTIQPLISAGKTEVPPGCAEAMRPGMTWDEGSDALLEQLVRDRGRKWKEISRAFDDCFDIECKNRCLFLQKQKRLR
jgi:hypothetical protein